MESSNHIGGRLRSRRKRRGITLIETLLALGVGAVVMMTSIVGLQRYTEGVRVEAAAGTLSRLATAADEWASENFQKLKAEAPRTYDVSVLRGYYSPTISTASLRDSFRQEYHIATRLYDYGEGRQALQLLVVGQPTFDLSLSQKERLRAEVANTSGAGAGFIATNAVGCDGSSPGDICGVFGTYSLPVSDFSSTGGGPDINWERATIVSLINKGDAAVYGEMLYRYDLGDEELNTMSTDLIMGGNDIIDGGDVDADNVLVRGTTSTSVLEAEYAKGIHTIDMANGPAGEIGTIRNREGQLTIEAEEGIRLRGTNALVNLTTPGGQMRVGSESTHSLIVGGLRSHNINGTAVDTGQGDIRAGRTWSDEIRARRINSLTGRKDDPLRLQHGGQARGEVIVGGRVRYTPDQGLNSNPSAGGRYEIADGTLVAGHLKAADITCADCGGSLSEILPKWRHMGTYFIQNLSPSQSAAIPFPSCEDNRRDPITRAGYADTAKDQRYAPRIIIVPRQLVSDPTWQNGGNQFYANFSFRARIDAPNNRWLVSPQPMDRMHATGLAMTYCVFIGGQSPAPTSTHVPAFGSPGRGTWAVLD